MDTSPEATVTRSRCVCWLLLAAALALLALLLPPAAAEAKKRPGCKPKGAKTVALNHAIRVYRISRRTRDGRLTRTYACRTKTRRRIRMSSLSVARRDVTEGGGDSGTVAYGIQLQGRFVAYGLRNVNDARSKYMQPQPGDAVLRIDVAQRKARRTLAATPDFATVADLALTGRGAVAWIVKNNASAPISYAVALADAAGTRTLATGTDIAPDSLAMGRSFVYWMRAGGAFSTKLTY